MMDEQDDRITGLLIEAAMHEVADSLHGILGIPSVQYARYDLQRLQAEMRMAFSRDSTP